MANNFSIYAVKDSYIDFFEKNPSALYKYIYGNEDDEEEEQDENLVGTAPDGWPSEIAQYIGIRNANDRNVDLYHWILNGKIDATTGAGSIFQTWFNRNHSAIPIGQANESFAFKSREMPDLICLIEKIDIFRVKDAYAGWLLHHGKDADLSRVNCQPFIDEFLAFKAKLVEHSAENFGIVWVPG